MEDEETLVKNVQGGDLASFEALINRHSSHLRAFVAMKLPVPHLIDEIAHEAFVFAHRHINDFEAGTDFGKWLRAIAFNLIRKETLRYQRTAKNQEKFLDHCLIQSSANEGYGPESAVVAWLEECIKELPDNQKALLERKYSFAESSREMAGALGKSEAWVRTTLCRIRTALRSCINEKEAAAGNM
ncbi:MAG: sigma-70 family RNA polymerase sigma factor [Verrucomicrobiales bacterium]|nr:sigma-70 family RNA polymerase sigma factor [Verrucomicrobiales bacterium]